MKCLCERLQFPLRFNPYLNLKAQTLMSEIVQLPLITVTIERISGQQGQSAYSISGSQGWFSTNAGSANINPDAGTVNVIMSTYQVSPATFGWVNTPDGQTLNLKAFEYVGARLEGRTELYLTFKYYFSDPSSNTTNENDPIAGSIEFDVNVGADGKLYYQKSDGSWTTSENGRFWSTYNGVPNTDTIQDDRDS